MTTKFDYKILDNNVGIVNQILPHKNKWAWELYVTSLQNQWVPSDIKMADDITQWENGTVTEDEKLVVKRCLGFFAGSESLVSNNLLINAYKYITDAEARQYISLQVKEETVHNHTIVYICDSLNLDSRELYEAYESIPCIKDKDDYLISVTTNLEALEKKCSIDSIEFRQAILNNLVIYYMVCEGCLFYSGFAMLLALRQQGKLKGIAQQIEYTVRDESNHVKFGTQLLNVIKTEYPELWTDQYKNKVYEYFDKAVELETKYAKEVLPRGILGLNSTMFMNYIQFIANRRLEAMGLKPKYPSKVNPFTWLSEAMDLETCGNFFETRERGYKTGAMIDDF